MESKVGNLSYNNTSRIFNKLCISILPPQPAYIRDSWVNSSEHFTVHKCKAYQPTPATWNIIAFDDHSQSIEVQLFSSKRAWIHLANSPFPTFFLTFQSFGMIEKGLELGMARNFLNFQGQYVLLDFFSCCSFYLEMHPNMFSKFKCLIIRIDQLFGTWVVQCGCW